jgi:hypothetical protein
MPAINPNERYCSNNFTRCPFKVKSFEVGVKGGYARCRPDPEHRNLLEECQYVKGPGWIQQIKEQGKG